MASRRRRVHRSRGQGAANRAGAGRGAGHRRGPSGQTALVYDEQVGSWTTTADRWHVGFCDLSGGQGLLAQVEGRSTATVTGWLAARPQAWRVQIQAVAIDMCTVFKAALRQVLPHAVLVVDHFHIVQLANRAVTEVRRRTTLTQRGRRGRGTDPEWRMRNRLTRSAARMHGTAWSTTSTPSRRRSAPRSYRVERERGPARPAREPPTPSPTVNTSIGCTASTPAAPALMR